MGRALKAYIDKSALKHNFQHIKDLTHGKKILAMIKANAYGHGLVQVASYLSEADAFGVACLEEAQQLRQAGIFNKIVLMEGFFESEEITESIKLDLEAVIHHDFQLKLLSERTFQAPFHIWVKIDTGMSRLGIAISRAKEVIRSLQAMQNIHIQGIMTHFSSADELDNPKTQRQFEQFQQVQKHFSDFEVSLANSAALLKWPQTHGDWVRPGLCLYGVSPFEGMVGAEFQFKPVMSLESQIIALHEIQKGTEVGYGGIFQAPERMPIATVAVGYGDGYSRTLPSGTPVLVKDTQTQLIGRVSMDMISIDLRGVPNPKIGDKVTLWGPKLPVEKIAAFGKTIPHTLLTGLSMRVPLVAKGA